MIERQIFLVQQSTNKCMFVRICNSISLSNQQSSAEKEWNASTCNSMAEFSNERTEQEGHGKEEEDERNAQTEKGEEWVCSVV